MDKCLRSYSSRLYVVQGQPIAVLEELFQRWNVCQLTYQRDMEPYSQGLEESVGRVSESFGVKVRLLGDVYGNSLMCLTPGRLSKPQVPYF